MKHDNRKTLGSILLAALALGAVAVTNASAERTGHFTSDSGGLTKIVGHESSTHRIEFSSDTLTGIAEPIFCHAATYQGSTNLGTTQEIRVKPTYAVCETTPEGSGDEVHVNFGQCEYKLTSRTTGDATAGLVCPNAGERVVLTATHSGCVLRFPPQTVANAVKYDTTVENNKHAITLTATASGITFTAHSGLCIFVRTHITDGELTGSATATGRNENSEPVNITAT